MKSFISSIVTLLVSAVLSTEIDYYWRNYKGEVPSDAIQAGLDKTGKPIYIGQGFFARMGLLPATVHPGSTSLIVTANQEIFYTDTFIKILCSGHPQNFQWTHINSYADIGFLTNVHIVEGGIETNAVVYIGRVEHEGSLEVGKVYTVAPDQGLNLPNHHQKETRYHSFDILTYNLTNVF